MDDLSGGRLRLLSPQGGTVWTHFSLQWSQAEKKQNKTKNQNTTTSAQISPTRRWEIISNLEQDKYAS